MTAITNEWLLVKLDDKILKYDDDMEGADWEEFIKAEWAAGAMRQLKKEILVFINGG